MLALYHTSPSGYAIFETIQSKPLLENLSTGFPMVTAELGEVTEKQNKLARSFHGESAPSTRTRLSEKNWHALLLHTLTLLNKVLAVVVSPYP